MKRTILRRSCLLLAALFALALLPGSALALGTDFDGVERVNQTQVTVTMPQLSGVSYEWNAEGELVFTVNELSAQEVSALYISGMSSILASVFVQRPNDTYTSYAWRSGNMDYASFMKYAAQSSSYVSYSGPYGNGIELAQVDQSANGITVTPGGHDKAFYFAWKDSSGNVLYQVVKCRVVLGQNANILDIPSSELNLGSPVPDSRMALVPSSGNTTFTSKYGSFTYTESTGLALFNATADPEKIIAECSQTNLYLELRITAPGSGYDTCTMSIDGRDLSETVREANGNKFVEFGRSMFNNGQLVTSEQTVTLRWASSSGQATVTEYFTFKSDLNGRTWMDIYWLPGSSALLNLNTADYSGSGFGITVNGHTITAAFDNNIVPDVDRAMSARLELVATGAVASAASIRNSSSSGSRGTGYDQQHATEQKNTVAGMPLEELAPGKGREACPLTALTLNGVTYWYADSQQNNVWLIQYYDANGNLITIEQGGKQYLGYYFILVQEPYAFKMESAAVESEDSITSAPQAPVLIGQSAHDGGGRLHTHLFAQHTREKKYYLEFTTNGGSELFAGGAKILIPYSIIEGCPGYSEIQAKGFKFKLHHYDDDKRLKETITATPLPEGILFEVKNGLSPFIVEWAEGTTSGEIGGGGLVVEDSYVVGIPGTGDSPLPWAGIGCLGACLLLAALYVLRRKRG